MKTIPSDILDQINRDTIGDAFVPLLHFALTDSTDLYYANYSEDVVYGGQTYTAWPFAGQLLMAGKGTEVPTATLTIDDACRVLRPYAIRTQWFRGCQLTLTIISMAHPTESYSWNRVVYDIKQAVPQGEAIQLRLGGPNLTKLRFPRDRYFADQCPYAKGFKDDPRCGYSGELTTCNGSPADCEERDNLVRYGGKFGLDPDAAKLVLPFRLPSGG